LSPISRIPYYNRERETRTRSIKISIRKRRNLTVGKTINYKVVPVHEDVWGSKSIVPSILNLGQFHTPAHFTLKKTASSALLLRDCVGIRACPDDVKKRNISVPAGN
jgi:hypothetical protein